jgi:hypothetical protein
MSSHGFVRAANPVSQTPMGGVMSTSPNPTFHPITITPFYSICAVPNSDAIKCKVLSAVVESQIFSAENSGGHIS